MKLILRFFVILVVSALVLALFASGGFIYLSRRPFPQTSGALRLPGLSSSVEVMRDVFGVPHIYADTPEDLFRAQGFVHAQDRFFQMEFWRRIGQGRLAELFGASALNQDKFIRTVGWHRVAEEEARRLDSETLRALQSYAEGVNAYILPNADRLGLEFAVLGLIGRRWSPEPWTPVNTLTWGKAMSFNLGHNLEREIVRLALFKRGGQALVDAVLPPYPDDMPVIVKAGHARYRNDVPTLSARITVSALAVRTLQTQIASLRSAIGLPSGAGIGSNNWVVAGGRTTTGRPLLANDPHLGIQMPSIWYINGLHCRVVNEACPYDVVGVTFPGVPGVVIGHNQWIAWGVTNVGPDTQDLFIERPSPDDPGVFEFQGRFEPARIREERIFVAGQAEPVLVRVRETRHGPIINDALDELRGLEPMALRWTALQPGQLFKAVLLLNKAQNWAQFRQALRYWDTPAQNFVYADVDGNIGYQMPGNIPIRKRGDGLMPVPGWSGEYEWVASIPFEALPAIFNPPEGYIVTANNAVVDAKSYPYLISLEWDYGYRAKRIESLLNQSEKVGLTDMQAIQNDTYSLFADEVIAFLERLALPVVRDSLAGQALARLKAWDRTCDVSSVGATIFEVFWRELSRAVFADEVGEDLADDVLGDGTHAQIALRNILSDPNAIWWDDVTSAQTEQREQIIVRALERTARFLESQLGNDPDSWSWGRLHTVVFANQTLGRSGIALIERIFNRGPFPAPGSMGLVNAVSSDAVTFAVRSAPSWRVIYDVSEWDNSVGIHTTGQSGHAYHQNYDDLIARWLKGEYLPLAWTRAAVERNTQHVLLLSP